MLYENVIFLRFAVYVRNIRGTVGIPTATVKTEETSDEDLVAFESLLCNLDLRLTSLLDPHLRSSLFISNLDSRAFHKFSRFSRFDISFSILTRHT